MHNDFSEAMDFRHACKRFDETKKIPDEALRFILEAGRNSPSSFGMEPWKFLVVSGEKLKGALRPLCWDQPQITTCSHLVVYLAAIENVRPDSGIPARRFARRPLPPERIEAYNHLYASFLADTLADDERTFEWTARQCYIALGNMMTGAASLGIDSCAIEGMDRDAVESLLGIDTARWRVAVLCAFGYRVKTQPERIRQPFDEVVEFLEA